MITESSFGFFIRGSLLPPDEPTHAVASQREGKDERCAGNFKPSIGSLKPKEAETLQFGVMAEGKIPEGTVTFSGFFAAVAAVLLNGSNPVVGLLHHGEHRGNR